MALTVGELQVQLEAQTREFTQALRRVEGRLTRFERNATSTVGNVARGFTLAVGAITAVGGALAAIGAVRGLVRLASGSIEAASSFERFEVQLANFIGTASEARTAVANLAEAASRTPFSVQQLVQAGTILGSVTLGNRQSLEELTDVATNLAAVTGLSLQEAASNLQRSLSAGIASADLFRERGVRQLIEAIQGIPDSTKLSLEELEQAFRDTFGPGGPFGDAAEALSFTLGGAISNVDDALTNLRAALGEAFRPAIVAGLREFLIPLLERLRELVIENREDIADFAQRGVVLAARALALLARGVASAVRTFAGFRRTLLGFQGAFNEVVLSITRFLNQVRQIPAPVRAAIAATNPAFQALNALANTVTDDTVGALEALQDELAAEAARTTESEQAFLDLANGADVLAREVTNAAEALGNLDFDRFDAEAQAARETSDALRDALARAAAGGAVDPRQTRAAESALERLRTLEARVRQERLAAAEPLLAEIDRVNEQINRVRELGAASGDRARAERVVNALLERQVELADRLDDARAETDALESVTAGQLAELARLDPAASQEIALDFAEALRGAEGAEARAEVARDFGERIRTEVEDALERLRQSPSVVALSGALGAGFTQALQGSLTDFLPTFGSSLRDAAVTNLQDAFQESLAELAPSIAELFGAGGALGSALLGIGGALLSGLTSDDAISSAAANVQSAVTSTQRVRGLVAGPQDIAIAQVGESIRQAFVESERLLRIIAENTGQVAINTGGGAATAAGEDAATVLATETPSLI